MNSASEKAACALRSLSLALCATALLTPLSAAEVANPAHTPDAASWLERAANEARSITGRGPELTAALRDKGQLLAHAAGLEAAAGQTERSDRWFTLAELCERALTHRKANGPVTIALVHGLARAGRFDEASQRIETLPQGQDRIAARAALARGLALNAPNASRAAELRAQADPAAATAWVAAFAAAGDFEGFQALVAGADLTDDRRAALLVGLAQAQAQAGDLAQAHHSFDQAMALGGSEIDDTLALAGAYAALGRVDEAAAAVNTLQQPAQQIRGLAQLAAARAAAGDHPGALADLRTAAGLAERFPDAEGLQSATYELARVAAERGHATEIGAWIDMLHSPRLRAAVALGLGQSLLPQQPTPPAIAVDTPPTHEPPAVQEDAPDTAKDVVLEVTPDATPDVAMDVAPDATPDVALEVTPDATPDVALDVTPDATPDVALDVTPDATPDVALEVTPDATPDVALEVTPDATPDVALEVTPDAAPDVALDVTPDAAPDVALDVTPDAAPDPDADAASARLNQTAQHAIDQAMAALPGAPVATLPTPAPASPEVASTPPSEAALETTPHLAADVDADAADLRADLPSVEPATSPPATTTASAESATSQLDLLSPDTESNTAADGLVAVESVPDALVEPAVSPDAEIAVGTPDQAPVPVSDQALDAPSVLQADDSAAAQREPEAESEPEATQVAGLIPQAPTSADPALLATPAPVAVAVADHADAMDPATQTDPADVDTTADVRLAPTPAHEPRVDAISDITQDIDAPSVSPVDALVDIAPDTPIDTVIDAPVHTPTEPILAVPNLRRLANPDDPQFDAPSPAVYDAHFTTTRGPFTLRVHRDWAPLASDRFHQLCRSGFYNNNRFFRVVPGFVAQWGIHGFPKVSTAWRNVTLADEPAREHNRRGTVSFAAATTTTNTRTTQVFINLSDNTFLDDLGFTPFAEVVQGMDVVEQLFSGYGETPSHQQRRIQLDGNVFLDDKYPNLDGVVGVEIRTK